MNILFLTRLFYPHVGGVEKHISEIGKILIKKGHKVTVLTTSHDDSLRSNDVYQGINIIRFKQTNIKFIGLIYTWFWLLKNINLINQSDIVHIHDVFIWYWPLRLIFLGKPVYVTFHGQWGLYPIPLKDIIQKRIGAALSKGVICIGEYISKNYGIKANIVSYGAVNIPKGKIDKSVNSIVYVGRLDENMGLPIFLKALSYLKQNKRLKMPRVDFCGDGKLRQKCEKYGKVHGWTDPTNFYRRARYCFASGYLTTLEAFSNKCMVFAAYQNSLQKDYYELTPFRKYIALFDNPEDLYKSIIYAQKNFGVYSEILEEALKWSERQTWDKMVNNYLILWGEK